MWRYEISSGWFGSNAIRLAQGYSGSGAFKNDPSQTSVVDQGPLPVGMYSINAPIDTKTHGPCVMWLTPDPANQMFGRSAFGIHGDSIVDPGNASEGCIILPRFARDRIWESGDHLLEVVA